MHLHLTALLLVGMVFAFVPSSWAQQKQDGDQRLALLIANANYPDAEAPLASPAADARALADELRRSGFDVDLKEDLTKELMQRSLETFYSKIKHGATALLFFSGYGIQTGRQSYLIPKNAQIWTEAEVKRDGFSLDAILAEMNARGANVKIAILDASRRNPFERRFNRPSSGLATVNLPKGTIVFYSAVPGYVAPESDAKNSLFVSELLKEMRAPGLAVEEIFNRTRIGVTRASKGEQVPWISSLVLDDVYFGPAPKPAATTAAVEKADDDARRDYEAAERTGTRKGWEDFLQKHKLGPYAKQAREQMAKLDVPAAPERKPAPAAKGREQARAPAEPAPKAAAPEPARAPADPAAKAKTPETPAATTEKKPSVAAVSAGTAATGPRDRETTASRPADPAIRELDERLKLNPRDGDGFYKRGQLYAAKGEYKLALYDFSEAIQLNPNDAEALNNRCFVRAVLGELDAAVADCEAALRLRPGFADASDSLGFAYLKKGMLTNAIASYDAVLKQSPRQPSALFGRGKAKVQNGSVNDGNADIAEAKKVQPDIAEEFARYGVR